MTEKITTIEISEGIHRQIRDLADKTGFRVKRLSQIIIEDGIKVFKKQYSTLLKKSQDEN